MINKHFFEIVLVLLASSLSSLELKLVLFQQRRVNRESFKLLNHLQTSLVQRCLPKKNFLLPHKAVSPRQCEKGALTILHETLQQIFNLFGANISLDGWEESQMKKFHIELHQQLESTIGSDNLRLRVKMYFQRICNYLENQEYSSCAWTIVHVEINRCLFFVFRLTGTLSKQEMDP
ncbi:LOW QUALITY PROTEIN: interferon epsilon [Glossophaga mutica]